MESSHAKAGLPPIASLTRGTILVDGRNLGTSDLYDGGGEYDYTISCSPRADARVSIFLGRNDEGRDSPTGRYKSGTRPIRAVRENNVPDEYRAACDNSRNVAMDFLGRFRVDTGWRAGGMDRSFHHAPKTQDILDRLIREYAFAGKGRVTEGAAERVGRVAFQGAEAAYYGIDIERDGSIDVLQIEPRLAGYSIIIYNMGDIAYGSDDFTLQPAPRDRPDYTDACTDVTDFRGIEVRHPAETPCPPDAELCFDSTPAAIAGQYFCLASGSRTFRFAVRSSTLCESNSESSDPYYFWSSSLPRLPEGHKWIHEDWRDNGAARVIYSWGSATEGNVVFNLKSRAPDGKIADHFINVPVTWDGRCVAFRIPLSL